MPIRRRLHSITLNRVRILFSPAARLCHSGISAIDQMGKNNFMSLKKLSVVLMGLCFLATPVWADISPVDLPLPMVGTDAHGHAYPGATVPFGMVQLSPDTP